MDFIRVKSLAQLTSITDRLLELFNEYIERSDYGRPAEVLLETCARYIGYSDHIFFIFINGNSIEGFVLCNLMGNSQKAILYIDDVYCPYSGLKAWGCIKAIARVFGAQEVWGRVNENTYRTFRRNVKDAIVENEQIVRITLWEANQVSQKASQES